MTETEKIENYFLEKLPETLDDGSQYPILLVVTGEKEAALTMNCNEEQIQVLKQLCADFGLEYRIGKGRKSKPSRAIGENKEMDQKGFFIARKPERFDLLEEGRFYGFSDFSVGRFLGFPDKAVDFFDNEEQPSMISRQKIANLRKENVFGDDLKYLNLVTYVPPPEEESIRKGIERGKKRERKLERFDEENSSLVGEKYLEKRFSRNLYR